MRTLLSPFARRPERCAERLTCLAVSPEAEGVTGAYFHNLRPAQTSKEARDPEVAPRLRGLSEQMVGPVDRATGPPGARALSLVSSLATFFSFAMLMPSTARPLSPASARLAETDVPIRA